METRLAVLGDAPVLAALHGESFGDARWSAAQIADSLALDTAGAWVASENGAARGFILCQIAGLEAEILTFCVAPAARRKGVGRALLETAIAAARAKNARQIFLEVAADNEAARALYEKARFRVSGKRAGYYRRDGQAVDALMFEKELG